MESFKHLYRSTLLTFAILTFGTVGYMLIEDWPLLDALYQTVITISTVGFSEVHSISPAGRAFTIILVFIGVGFVMYVAGAVVQFMVEGRLRAILGRRRLDRKIGRLKDHYIVCGYGRIGKVLCHHLARSPHGVMVIEKNPEMASAMEADGILYLTGDAADEDNLTKAGIEHARGLIAVLATDVANVYLVLTARQLSASLFIMARASNAASASKLRAAGANQVESPYVMGAFNMASKILRPTVTSFLDIALGYKNVDIQMEEIPVDSCSPLANVQLKDSGIRQNYNVIVIAVKASDGQMSFNPSFETVIQSGETIIAVGSASNLKRLAQSLHPDFNNRKTGN